MGGVSFGAMHSGGGGIGGSGGGSSGGGGSLSMMTHPGAEVDVGEDFRSPPKVLRLVSWVEGIILHQGGRVIGANLGSALASSNGSLYKAIKGALVCRVFDRAVHCSTLDFDGVS